MYTQEDYLTAEIARLMAVYNALTEDPNADPQVIAYEGGRIDALYDIQARLNGDGWEPN